MEIRNLIQNEKMIRKVVTCLWKEWGTTDDFHLWNSWVRSSLYINKIPQTFVAVEGEKLLGTVSLWNCDAQSRQDISAWLGGLFVFHEHRMQGLGKCLVAHAETKAKEVGITKLHLFTDLDGYFEGMDWIFDEYIAIENGQFRRLLGKCL